jgi:Flp pilus assembly protein TadG
MVCKSVSKTRGAAMLELALLSPWVIFLFIGALDWGFYAVSLVTLENATRVAAVYASSSTGNITQTGIICGLVINEMGSLSNMQGVSTCGGSSPVSVTPTLISPGIDGSQEAKVSVTYTTPPLIPIPGLLAKQFTITRTVKMRI